MTFYLYCNKIETMKLSWTCTKQTYVFKHCVLTAQNYIEMAGFSIIIASLLLIVFAPFIGAIITVISIKLSNGKTKAKRQSNPSKSYTIGI